MVTTITEARETCKATKAAAWAVYNAIKKDPEISEQTRSEAYMTLAVTLNRARLVYMAVLNAQ